MDMGRMLKAGFGVLGVVFLTACGGGSGGSSDTPGVVGYSGKSTAAVIDESNKQGLATSAAKNTAYQIDMADKYDASEARPLKAGPVADRELVQRVISVLDEPSQKQVRSSQRTLRTPMESGTVAGDCGGSYSYDGTETSGVIVFNNYCTYDITINGKAEFTSSGLKETQVMNLTFTVVDYSGDVVTGSVSGTSVVVYDDDSYLNYTETFNIKATVDGETFTQAGEERYENNVLVSESVFYTEGDTVYKAEVTSEFTTGSDGSYSGQMTLYDPAYGYVTVTATSLVPCSDGSGFASGTITIADESGNSASVTFNGCGQDATLTFNGNSEPISIQ